MNLLTTKNFNGIQLDCYQAEDNTGDFWATREQIGQLLGYAKPRNAITKIHQRYKERLDKFSKVVELRKYFDQSQLGTPFKNEPVATVYNFRGLLEICRWSNQPKANAVMDFLWDVADDIRKHGMYMSNKTLDKYKNDPEAFNALLEKYVAEKTKVKQLEAQIEADRQYTNLGKIVVALPGSITFGEAAKFYAQHGFDIGRNRLMKLCREVKYLCSQKSLWNRPSQKGIESGFTNIELDVTGGMRFTTRPMLTPEGVQAIYEILLEMQRPLELLWNLEGETE